MSIEVQHLSKTFGRFTALDDVSLRIGSGELVALLGPSGSGKTTLLRIIAGLEWPDDGSGSVHFHDEEVGGLGAAQRRVGFVFQHYALFRHMTVFENVAFGLRVRPRAFRPTEKAIQTKVLDLLKLVQLESLAGRRPAQLSGGQRQRVALARALAVEPRVLLLDEPFGALDARVRRELRRWIRRLHDEIHITSLFVTHDQEEALEVADRVVLMKDGRIEQVGTPEEVYDRPASAFVANFLGNVNIFEGRIHEGRLRVGGIEWEAPANDDGRPGVAQAFVRTHDIHLAREAEGPGSRPGIIRRIHAAGPLVRVEVEPEGGGLVIEVGLTRERHRELGLRPGERVFFILHRPQIFREDDSI